MSLLEEARAAQVHAHVGPTCSIALLDPELRAEVEEALADSTLYSTTISAELKARKVNISAFKLNWHRKGRCQCQ